MQQKIQQNSSAPKSSTALGRYEQDILRNSVEALQHGRNTVEQLQKQEGFILASYDVVILLI